MGTLSHVLIDFGFFSALGTTEMRNGKPQIVGRGAPFTVDSNNGITAVYDERGRPWIIAGENFERVVDEAAALRDFREVFRGNARKGAYVPHSNDGGNFVRTVLMKLMA